MVSTRNNVYFIEVHGPNFNQLGGLLQAHPPLLNGHSVHNIEDITETSTGIFVHSYVAQREPAQTREGSVPIPVNHRRALRTLDTIVDDKGNNLISHMGDTEVEDNYRIDWMLPFQGKIYYKHVVRVRHRRRRSAKITIRSFPTHQVVDDPLAEDIIKAHKMRWGVGILPLRLEYDWETIRRRTIRGQTTHEYNDMSKAWNFAADLRPIQSVKEVRVWYPPFTPQNQYGRVGFYEPTGVYFDLPYPMLYNFHDANIIDDTNRGAPYQRSVSHVVAFAPVSKWVYDSVVVRTSPKDKSPTHIKREKTTRILP